MCDGQQKGWVSICRHPTSLANLLAAILALILADSKHLGATYRTHALSHRLAILESYGPGVLHFPLGTALQSSRHHISQDMQASDMLWTTVIREFSGDAGTT